MSKPEVKGHNGYGNSLDKNPSIVLVKSTEKDHKFEEWGYESKKLFKTKYQDFVENRITKDEFNCYSIVNNIKLSLYDDIYDKKYSKEFKELKDKNGETLITEYLTKFYQEIFKELKNIDPNLVNDNIRWCFSVPSFWRFEQIQKMKECCMKAGFIYSIHETFERFCFCYEPEAAALSIKNKKNNQLASRFIIYDLGGGTVDLTCHKYEKNSLEELHLGKGKVLGSQLLDLNFYNYFLKLFNIDGSFFEDNLDVKEFLIDQWIKEKENAEGGELTIELNKKIYDYLNSKNPTVVIKNLKKKVIYSLLIVKIMKILQNLNLKKLQIFY